MSTATTQNPRSTASTPTHRGPVVAACLKWVDLHPDIDPLTGHVSDPGASSGFSPADRAAVEIALRLAEEWDGTTLAVCAGPPAADAGLRDLAAAGVDRVVRIDVHTDPERGPDSATTAAILAGVLDAPGAVDTVVVCGDLSYDRGSGSVPAVLAHHLGAAQALGLVEVAAVRRGTVRATRRLDGGRREHVEATMPMVLSVEGSVADLRRAPLAASLAALDADPVERHPAPPLPGVHDVAQLRPWRPPPRTVGPPTGEEAFGRVVQLTGALVDRTPPQVVEADPATAARLVKEHLESWGYLGDDAVADPESGP